MAKEITTRKENYSQWYNDVAIKAELAENSDVRGCMVIRPYGYAIWEKMQAALDGLFKKTGHKNAYFPLFIPKSFFSKEASHVEGFAKECAVVTHYRLKNDPDGKGIIVDEDAKLEEELIVRPTSETIIWNTYKRWIQSYRDLPILINQWANVVRWEMRPRLFLRTTEFLWQEGHTAHATEKEALEETYRMLDVYAEFAEQWLALPVKKGRKTEAEKFAGAVETITIEALMQDGKALQSGTSHFLGQNFAKAFDVKYLSNEGKLDYVWATSWGLSTRMMGALIMAHGDDNGLIIPPKLAPSQVIIIPIYKTGEEYESVVKTADELKARISKRKIFKENISVEIDKRDTYKPGWKFAHYELKGYPLRIVLGPRDIENGTLEVTRRDTLEKRTYPQSGIEVIIQKLLQDIQKNIHLRALEHSKANSFEINSYEEFKEINENQGGFLYAHWDGTPETELKIKEETKATIRCIPFDKNPETGKCIYSGKPSKRRVIFAKAY